MTDAPAAILATFQNWKPIPSRGVLQLYMEVPIEQTTEVLLALGHADPKNPRWVGIALLTRQAAEEAAKAKQAKPAVPNQSSPVNTREKRNWNELPPATQAGIRCSEPAFQKFLDEHYHATYSAAWLRTPDATKTAAEVIRKLCNIDSRADLVPGSQALEVWSGLNDRYEAWMRAAV